MVGWDARGGKYFADDSDVGPSPRGTVAYLVSKTKEMRGGALWFPASAFRFTARAGQLGPRLPYRDQKRYTVIDENDHVVGGYVSVAADNAVFTMLRPFVPLNKLELGQACRAKQSRGPDLFVRRDE